MQRFVLLLLISILSLTTTAGAAEVVARFVPADDTAFAQPEPTHDLWQHATPVTVPLLPQNITMPSKFAASVASLEVGALHNGAWLAVIVRWADPTLDESNAQGLFSDAVAMSMPLHDPATTSPFMGQPGVDVELTYWKALWQRDINRGYQDVTDLHPNTQVDVYWHTEARGPYPVQEVLRTPEARQWLPAIASGNSMSQLQRSTPVEQLVAEGFGTLTTQKRQDARGAGVYGDGKWTVVLTRPLLTGDASDLPLRPGLSTAINFAVWDGGSGDRGARKNYSLWTPLRLEAGK